MQVKMSVVSNLWIKQMEFEGSGDKMAGHKHTFDHQTLLAAGDFIVKVDGKEYEYSSPTIVYIEKDREHEITCISENGLGYCIHPIRDGERVEDIVAEEDMPLIGGKLKQSLVNE